MIIHGDEKPTIDNTTKRRQRLKPQMIEMFLLVYISIFGIISSSHVVLSAVDDDEHKIQSPPQKLPLNRKPNNGSGSIDNDIDQRHRIARGGDRISRWGINYGNGGIEYYPISSGKGRRHSLLALDSRQDKRRRGRRKRRLGKSRVNIPITVKVVKIVGKPHH